MKAKRSTTAKANKAMVLIFRGGSRKMRLFGRVAMVARESVSVM